MIKTAQRLEGIGEYYFATKLREIDQLNKDGKNIISLGIGSPDLPPHPEVIKVLQDESSKANVHAYQSYKGSPVLRNAIAAWYKEWYHVELNPETEVLPLIGSKEGIMHICMTYLDKGDEVLVPNPGYPTYRSAVKLAGGVCVDYNLSDETQWEPDFEAIEKLDLSKVKLMWINYPQMPTGKLPSEELFTKIISFGKKHSILICHDNPYSFILNDKPASILNIEGAKEVALELNSLSKSQNMAGWRIGMLVGAAERINEVMRFKSNMDSGMFLPVQLAAAKALGLGKEWYGELNKIYAGRRSKVFELLDLLGCSYDRDQAGMFVWAKIPATEESGYKLSDKVLYGANVFITPGGIFGSAGDNYVRVSLCCKDDNIEAAKERIKKSL
ncbi:MAG: aminotransferase class I/II-fold pyridoxal phosphate-dependent enzyme [Chitinophagaceae bacterium]|nr:MAG: aminotransferase class I/II-fold pyridoxal phosphate-dependent enzyme [Chitinophagaceae bacterium]